MQSPHLSSTGYRGAPGDTGAGSMFFQFTQTVPAARVKQN
jgi:hypothetical protein